MPYQRAPLVLLDELVLAVAVCADVVREAGGERRLELAVGRARFGVGAHVVAVGDVARYRMNGVVLVGVQLVRAVRAALPEIAAARQAGIRLSALSSYYMDDSASCPPGTLVLGYGALDDALCAPLAAALSETLKKACTASSAPSSGR